ncbi:hypothetical protein HYH03_014603 [Edaphochlamys debaryana]|uniref:Uncharacterized protein n=1 Tax=Edaphochlamys debaryana TaxID=47281 RepID=A0A836BTG1_9CHLO|nr:hypothetical protein HYH03_014603 [Edaphochlamys debaryana]|eukprot:KAG2486804.1 hypothetical protein HYH03_014603 [Edaphochlamys debaryana]
MKVLSHLDPNQPLMISDHLWYEGQHPNQHAARCLPCGFDTSLIRTEHSQDGTKPLFVPRPACPFCTYDFSCGAYDATHHCNASHDAVFRDYYSPRLLGRRSNSTGRLEDTKLLSAQFSNWYRYRWGRGGRGRPMKEETPKPLDAQQQTLLGQAWRGDSAPFPFCVRHDDRVHKDVPMPNCNTGVSSVFHGGSGLVLSVGMMRALDLDTAEAYIRTGFDTGGDALFARAIKAQGFAHTDPGLRYKLGVSPPDRYNLFVESMWLSILDDLENFVQCKRQHKPEMTAEERIWILEYTIALHVHAALQQVEAVVAMWQRRAEVHMILHEQLLRAKRQRGGAAGAQALYEAMRLAMCPEPPMPLAEASLAAGS